MLKVGVTGGIGSGKSFVCEVFSLLGISVFEADKVAKELMNTDIHIVSQLKQWFGPDVYLPDGTIHRKYLAGIIFNDKIALQNVNGIVHPAVRNAFQFWSEKQEGLYVIQEAAILFESGMENQFDRIITVTAPLEDRIKRVIHRDKMTREKVIERMRNQLPDDEKINRSHFVVHADDQHLVIPQVINIDKKLKEIWQNLENG